MHLTFKIKENPSQVIQETASAQTSRDEMETDSKSNHPSDVIPIESPAVKVLMPMLT